VEGKPVVATPGTVCAIPPDARHSGRALTACRIMDVFYPVREDYRDGAGATILGDAAKSG
jgi:quercetin dioxygenase-like cupin family protein